MSDRIARLRKQQSAAAAKSRATKPQEERIAELLDGRRLPGSGAKPVSRTRALFASEALPVLTDDHSIADPVRSSRKTQTAQADIATDRWWVEHKRTIHQSISLKKGWLDRVSDGAYIAGKYPALVVTFEPSSDWVLVPMDVFLKLHKG